MEAAEGGRRTFISKHKCKCGCNLRYTLSSACVPCAKARSMRHQDKVRKLLAAAADE
jgi:hypothetical protein